MQSGEVMEFVQRMRARQEERRRQVDANERAAEHVRKGGMVSQVLRWDAALEEFDQAIELASERPVLAKAHVGAFLAHGAMLRTDEAMRHYEALKRIDPAKARKLEATPAFAATVRMRHVFFA